MSYNESLSNNSNYPPMSQSEWDSAPWNQTEPDEKEFDVLCSQTLSKSFKVLSSNYTEGYDEERDDDGHTAKIPWIDTQDIDWESEFKYNEHHTPLELINLFKQCLEDNLHKGIVFKTPHYTKHLIEECEGWVDDETVIIEE